MLSFLEIDLKTNISFSLCDYDNDQNIAAKEVNFQEWKLTAWYLLLKIKGNNTSKQMNALKKQQIFRETSKPLAFVECIQTKTKWLQLHKKIISIATFFIPFQVIFEGEKSQQFTR